MEFKTTEGITIYSANVIKTNVKFGKSLNDVVLAKAKIDGDRKWYTIDKSSRRDFAQYAMKLQTNFMEELPVTNYQGNILEIHTDNLRENTAPVEPLKKKYPIIEVQTF